MTVILDNNYDENYQPTDQEIHDYAVWLGMDADGEDNELLWIAREGLKAPLPENWKACKTDKGELYYFNFKTLESIWDHPMDEHYKDLFKKEKEKKQNGTTTAEKGAPSTGGKSADTSQPPDKKKVTLLPIQTKQGLPNGAADILAAQKKKERSSSLAPTDSSEEDKAGKSVGLKGLRKGLKSLKGETGGALNSTGGSPQTLVSLSKVASPVPTHQLSDGTASEQEINNMGESITHALSKKKTSAKKKNKKKDQAPVPPPTSSKGQAPNNSAESCEVDNLQKQIQELQAQRAEEEQLLEAAQKERKHIQEELALEESRKPIQLEKLKVEKQLEFTQAITKLEAALHEEMETTKEQKKQIYDEQLQREEKRLKAEMDQKIAALQTQLAEEEATTKAGGTKTDTLSTKEREDVSAPYSNKFEDFKRAKEAEYDEACEDLTLEYKKKLDIFKKAQEIAYTGNVADLKESNEEKLKKIQTEREEELQKEKAAIIAQFEEQLQLQTDEQQQDYEKKMQALNKEMEDRVMILQTTYQNRYEEEESKLKGEYEAKSCDLQATHVAKLTNLNSSSTDSSESTPQKEQIENHKKKLEAQMTELLADLDASFTKETSKKRAEHQQQLDNKTKLLEEEFAKKWEQFEEDQTRDFSAKKDQLQIEHTTRLAELQSHNSKELHEISSATEQQQQQYERRRRDSQTTLEQEFLKKLETDKQLLEDEFNEKRREIKDKLNKLEAQEQDAVKQYEVKTNTEKLKLDKELEHQLESYKIEAEHSFMKNKQLLDDEFNEKLKVHSKKLDQEAGLNNTISKLKGNHEQTVLQCKNELEQQLRQFKEENNREYDAKRLALQEEHTRKLKQLEDEMERKVKLAEDGLELKCQQRKNELQVESSGAVQRLVEELHLEHDRHTQQIKLDNQRAVIELEDKVREEYRDRERQLVETYENKHKQLAAEKKEEYQMQLRAIQRRHDDSLTSTQEQLELEHRRAIHKLTEDLELKMMETKRQNNKQLAEQVGAIQQMQDEEIKTLWKDHQEKLEAERTAFRKSLNKIKSEHQEQYDAEVAQERTNNERLQTLQKGVDAKVQNLTKERDAQAKLTEELAARNSQLQGLIVAKESEYQQKVLTQNQDMELKLTQFQQEKESEFQATKQRIENDQQRLMDQTKEDNERAIKAEVEDFENRMKLLRSSNQQRLDEAMQKETAEYESKLAALLAQHEKDHQERLAEEQQFYEKRLQQLRARYEQQLVREEEELQRRLRQSRQVADDVKQNEVQFERRKSSPVGGIQHGGHQSYLSSSTPPPLGNRSSSPSANFTHPLVPQASSPQLGSSVQSPHPQHTHTTFGTSPLRIDQHQGYSKQDNSNHVIDPTDDIEIIPLTNILSNSDTAPLSYLAESRQQQETSHKSKQPVVPLNPHLIQSLSTIEATPSSGTPIFSSPQWDTTPGSMESSPAMCTVNDEFEVNGLDDNEIHQISYIEEEKKRISQAHIVLKKYRREIKEKRRTLKDARLSWKKDVLMSRKMSTSDQDKKLLTHVHGMLEKQAATLNNNTLILQNAEQVIQDREERLAKMESMATEWYFSKLPEFDSEHTTADRSNQSTPVPIPTPTTTPQLGSHQHHNHATTNNTLATATRPTYPSHRPSSAPVPHRRLHYTSIGKKGASTPPLHPSQSSMSGGVAASSTSVDLRKYQPLKQQQQYTDLKTALERIETRLDDFNDLVRTSIEREDTPHNVGRDKLSSGMMATVAASTAQLHHNHHTHRERYSTGDAGPRSRSRSPVVSAGSTLGTMRLDAWEDPTDASPVAELYSKWQHVLNPKKSPSSAPNLHNRGLHAPGQSRVTNRKRHSFGSTRDATTAASVPTKDPLHANWLLEFTEQMAGLQ